MLCYSEISYEITFFGVPFAKIAEGTVEISISAQFIDILFIVKLSIIRSFVIHVKQYFSS